MDGGSADHEQVFRETWRVLQPGGRFRIWDVCIPARGDREETAFVVPLTVELPDGTRLKTGYGVGWDGREQSMAGLMDLAVAAGFRCDRANQNGEVFEMVLLKEEEKPGLVETLHATSPGISMKDDTQPIGAGTGEN